MFTELELMTIRRLLLDKEVVLEDWARKINYNPRLLEVNGEQQIIILTILQKVNGELLNRTTNECIETLKMKELE